MTQARTSAFLYTPSAQARQCHCPSLCMVDQQLMSIWYCYPEIEYEHGQLVIAEADHSGEWHHSHILQLPLTQSLGNACLYWDTKEQTLYCYFVVLRGRYWDRAEIMWASSTDRGRSFSEPTSIRRPLGEMVRQAPQQVGDELLWLTYDEVTHQVRLLCADRPQGPWRCRSEIGPYIIQGELIARGDDLLVLSRPTNEPHAIRCHRSSDRGHSWSNGLVTDLPCPLSGLAATDWNDRIVCVHNASRSHKRWPLSLSWSDDFGRTWANTVHLESATIEMSYPALTIDHDDRLHIAYSFNRRMIKHMALSPGWWDSY